LHVIYNVDIKKELNLILGRHWGDPMIIRYIFTDDINAFNH